ncbi:MAG: hypothetical protein NWF02_08240 [Candidatus Bathyarchaeota archaeon]|nr:hypothetical protein [Candidatus Bathyarchaeum sp.]
MSIQRIPTGMPEMDELLDGGFPSDAMILLTGNAGAGKTIFSSQFLNNCAIKYGTPGVYACLAETKECFLRNMKDFDLDFERLEHEKRVKILCLPVSKEAGVQTNLNKIMETMSSLNAKVLVIDSFSAIAMALGQTIDIRVMAHLLYSFIKRNNCLCILIVDKPRVSLSSFSGGEEIAEFIADGIITFEMYIDDSGVLRRRLRILKMRGANHSKVAHSYTIGSEGFMFLPPGGGGGEQEREIARESTAT